MVSLRSRAWLSLGMVGVIMGALLFGGAGTFRYPQAWVYLGLYIILSAGVIADLLHRDRALLERRMRGGPTAERRPVQRRVMLGASIGFVLSLLLPALAFRRGSALVPLAGCLLGLALFLVGFGLVVHVFRVNTYGGATIEVSGGQTVIDTGPYAVVRHPMYASSLLYAMGTPLALGSYWGFVGFGILAISIVFRLLDEERALASELPGYTDYQQRVRFRMIPGVW